jgi:putative ABC transport system ATP-binding protein
MSKLVEVRDLRRDYTVGTGSVHALDGISFDVGAGTFVSVMGPSGSGKSTLLHLVGALDTPTSGSVVLDGEELAKLDDEALTKIRRRKLGFIFQFFNLLPTMTAWENVALPKMLDGEKLGDLRPRAEELLARVGLAERVGHKPAQLSGGEMQRVAIARSLMSDPLMLLADEPTGNLDSKSGEGVLSLLRSLVADEGKTLIMVTHEVRAASKGDRLLELSDGKLVSDRPTDGVSAPATTERAD